MNDEELIERIDTLFRSIILNEKHKREIEHLEQVLSLSQEHIYAAWLLWDAKKRTYSNEVYSSDAMRLVMHLHNYLVGSWHEKRQAIVLKYLQQVKAKRICDIGFGTPQEYVRHFLHDSGTEILLTDFERSSLSFAKMILDYLNDDWKSRITLDLFDLNKDNLPKNFDAYLFQDSIEHADNPSETLYRYVAQMLKGTRVLFSLPIEIENPVPEHHIYWKNEAEIITWLKKAGLSTISYETIYMNKEVDIFSLFLHPDFRELVLLAEVD